MREITIARVHKNGSSLAVIIPRNLCRALLIDRGDQVVVGVMRGGVIVIRKLQDKEKERIIKF